MKFRVEREVLADAVTWVARGLPTRPPVPVLAGVMLEADSEGSLTLSTFDYEVSARITVPADVSDPGTSLVLGRMLSDITKNLPDRPIEMETDGNKVALTCGNSKFSLPLMPADEYPTLPSAPESSGTLDGQSFTQAVAQVAIAADRGDTLPILTGVRVEIEGETMTLIATDRYRLAKRDITWNPASPDASTIALIPARTLSETAKALGAAGTIDLALGGDAGGDGLIGFEAGQRRTTSRLLDGEYPKVASIFPTSTETEALVSTEELVEAVKRVAVVAERNTPVRLQFADDQVTIEAGAGDEAQATESVAVTLTGPDLEIAFNPTFLLDGLQAVGTPFTKFGFTQSTRPTVLSGHETADEDAVSSYRYVLMPVRFTS